MSLAPDRPDAPDRPPPASSPALPSALSTAGWVVGAGAIAPASAPAPVARQAARLEARLAVYAQHAATVAEQAAATLAGDLVRADGLAREREAAAEHFGELQATVSLEGAGGGELPSFGALLTDAMVELEHQAAVDVALRQRLVALRDAVSRGAAWAAGGVPALPAPALPAPAHDPAEPDPAGAPVRALEGGWVAARAEGVGRALGGLYPGVATRGDPAGPSSAGQDRAGSEGTAHVNLRF